MNHYLQIFRNVRQLLESKSITDPLISDNYESIFMNLSPDPYTFQQLMVEYISEFNIKSLDFLYINETSSGFSVRRINDVLLITHISDDLRFVVGDKITKLSGDTVLELRNRYKKLLFDESAEREDWMPILKKQCHAAVMRGDQHYEMELKKFERPSAVEISSREHYTHYVVHSFNEFLTIDFNGPALIDLTESYGIAENIEPLVNRLSDIPFVMLIDAMTKGSAERLAARFDGQGRLVGRETYGQAAQLETVQYDPYIFIYSADKDKTVSPDIMVELSESTLLNDELRKTGEKVLLSMINQG